MPMTLDEVAEVIIAGRLLAARTGRAFKVNPERCAAFGIAAAQMKLVQATVTRIEKYTARQLAALRSIESDRS